jgi:YbbR domain-containing protein
MMHYITDEWRLKLLAVGLAVLMLGAVAFSQNPPTTITLDKIPISYTVGPDIIVINPLTTTKVQVQGLADTLRSVISSSVAASFDLTKVSPGPSVHVNLVVRSLINGVTVLNPVVPQVLNIDRLVAVTVPVTVRTQQHAGWEVTKSEARCPAAPCSVTFTGPATWETNLAAFADFTDPVQQNSYDILTQTVLLVENGTPLDLTRRTEPAVSLSPSTVAIHIEAKTGTTSRQVTLIDAPASHAPPPGYRVTSITVDPMTVVISGDPTALAKITTITLPPVDLSGRTSDAVFQIAIPYPPGITGNPGNARVVYSISANPSVSPSPTPA